MVEQRFPKSRRVVKGDDFTQALRRGGCAADGVLVVFAYPHPESKESSPQGNHEPTRLGVTIPKKTGNAVIRNQWKRLIRESFRTQREQFPLGFDFVVRPKKDATLQWNAIHRGLPKLARKAVARIKPVAQAKPVARTKPVEPRS